MADLRFGEIERPRWSGWWVASLAAHVAIVALVWALHSAPPLFQVRATALGNGPRNYRLMYLGPTGNDALGPSEMPPSSLRLHAPRAAVRRPRAAQQEEPRKDADFAAQSAKAGTPYGSLYQGPYDGQDVRPPYPVVFPDPPIPHWLAQSVEGDVIVEVTIDEQGTVTDYRLLQGVRDDINQKVIEALLTWRFQPAVVDGVRVPSREDMHFHFPS